MSFEKFQYGCHGGHLGYQNETILAILNLCVAPMPPIKFWLNRTYRGGHLGYRNGAILAILNICVIVMPPSSSDSVWEEMSFEEFQDGRHGGHLGYRNGTIVAILNLCVTEMPSIKFQLNWTYGLGGDVV